VSAREPNGESRRDLLGSFLMVRREERGAVVLAIVYFFLILASYQVLRPIREQMGIAEGTSKLKYLWTFTLAGTAIASALFAKLSSAVPRRRFLPITYRVCAVCILVFGGLLTQLEGAAQVWLGYVFYVWLAVYALFGVSVFWSFMTDAFGLQQARRLFGTFAVGGTLGAMLGTRITDFLVVRVHVAWLFLIAAALIEMAVWCIGPLARRAQSAGPQPAEDEGLGGGAWEGWKLIGRSSYLANIALFTFLFYFVQTFAVRQQADIVYAEVIGREAQTQYYADVDFAQQSVTLLVQLFVTGRVMKALGVIGGLIMLPLICVGGFLALASAHEGAAPALVVVTVFLVLLKGLNHAAMRPAREALFVLSSRREKYQAKSVNDVFVARAGDLGAVWSYDKIFLPLLEGSMRGVSLVAIPFSILWAGIAIWLGVRNNRMTEAADAAGERRSAEPDASG
jgi:ATP:ADP antiporter, AAA family